MNVSDSHQVSPAHVEAFTTVKAYLEDHVIGRYEIVCFSSLCVIYIQELEHHGSPNPNFREGNQMARLKNNEMLNENPTFSKVYPGNKGCITYWLICRSD